MKIKIHRDEWWPWYFESEGGIEVDLPVELVIRIRALNVEADAVMSEIGRILDGRGIL